MGSWECIFEENWEVKTCGTILINFCKIISLAAAERLALEHPGFPFDFPLNSFKVVKLIFCHTGSTPYAVHVANLYDVYTKWNIQSKESMFVWLHYSITWKCSRCLVPHFIHSLSHSFVERRSPLPQCLHRCTFTQWQDICIALVINKGTLHMCLRQNLRIWICLCLIEQ